MKAILVTLFLLAGAAPAWARCDGVDFRSHMSAEQRAELSAEAQQVPFAYGNHWVARKGGRTIHVIGTFHGGDPRMGRVMRTLRPVIRKADAVLFEITSHALDEQYVQMEEHARYLFLPPGQSLKGLLAPAAWQRLAALSTQAGMHPGHVQRLQPWFAAQLLVSTGCIPYGFGIDRGLDERIERYAIRRRIPIGSLETVAMGYRAFAAIPLRDQARMLEYDLQMARPEVPPNATPLEAYFDEATWESLLLERRIMQHYVKAPPGAIARQWNLFDEHVIYRRNRQWMHPLLAAPGKTLVVAVGAAHLPGREGLLSLLQRRGFTLQRAPW
ncbi:TraB/GumN family protein [Roseobacteraceae bacterium NS-SX3]